MRHRLRVLLVGSAIALMASVVTMVAYALSTEPSGPSPLHSAISSATAGGSTGGGTLTRSLTATTSGPVTDSQVCGMVTSGEVYRLLNYVGSTGPGAPYPIQQGGACTWGTGQGEAFEITVVPRASGTGTRACAGLGATVVQADGWVGCNRLELGPGTNLLRAFKGSFVVSIKPEVNVVGDPYLLAEESTITHVFRELGV